MARVWAGRVGWECDGKENKLFVATGDDGKCRVFRGSSCKLLQTAHFQGAAENVRYDAAPNQIYVGYGEGTLGVLDAGERRETRRHCVPRPSRIIPVGGIRTTSVHELDQFLLVVSLMHSDKNSRNYGLYQGTPSGVPQRTAPDDRQGL